MPNNSSPTWFELFRGSFPAAQTDLQLRFLLRRLLPSAAGPRMQLLFEKDG